VYRRWLVEKVFVAGDLGTPKIMVLPIEVGKPNYRDDELP
jgi:hypothetical protein